MRCSNCGHQSTTGRFCPECGSKLEPPAGVKIGDVGYFKGTIDQSTHTFIGEQTNIEGGVTVNVTTPRKPDAGELLQKGISLLRMAAYEEAIKVLQEAISSEPNLADAYYYLALASLRGKRPKLLTRARTTQIEDCLRVACNLSSDRAHYYYLWAWVKYDFYVRNGFLVHPPGVQEILVMAGVSRTTHASIQELCQHAVVHADPAMLGILSRR